jgi:hypothetical protein
MKTESAYLVGIHRHSFRAGIPAKIIDVSFVTPEQLSPRVCYHVEYDDGKHDYIPICDIHHYEIISASDKKEGKISDIKY